MPRKRRYSTEQIIRKLREADMLLSQRRTAEEIARQRFSQLLHSTRLLV